MDLSVVIALSRNYIKKNHTYISYIQSFKNFAFIEIIVKNSFEVLIKDYICLYGKFKKKLKRDRNTQNKENLIKNHVTAFCK